MMKREEHICQNCKKGFSIEPEDFTFYEKMAVPPPTFCPRCRFQRRLAFFNLFHLYKRACDLCKKEYISMYHPSSPYVVYCPDCWWSDKKGRIYRYGEFFPAELSPSAYNETLASNFFPLSEKEVKAEGYTWQENEQGEYKSTKKAHDLPDHIRDVENAILNEVIECESCKKGFKLISMELEFLRKQNLPLPRLCPFCRIMEKFNQWVKELRVIKRTCANCKAQFTTPYEEKDFPIMYCKKCYIQKFA